jgi:hypothetical protein
MLKRLSDNVHLPFGRPFDKLTVLSKIEGLRYLHPSSLRLPARRGRKPSGQEALGCTSTYASFLWIMEALHPDIVHQPFRSRFFDSL